MRRGPVRWGTNEMGDQWVRGTNEFKQCSGGLIDWRDQWDGGPMTCTPRFGAYVSTSYSRWPIPAASATWWKVCIEDQCQLCTLLVLPASVEILHRQSFIFLCNPTMLPKAFLHSIFQLKSFWFHVNEASHSWDTAFSKFELENPRSRS